METGVSGAEEGIMRAFPVRDLKENGDDPAGNRPASLLLFFPVPAAFAVLVPVLAAVVAVLLLVVGRV